jgi:hypothetical protein
MRERGNKGAMKELELLYTEHLIREIDGLSR